MIRTPPFPRRRHAEAMRRRTRGSRSERYEQAARPGRLDARSAGLARAAHRPGLAQRHGSVRQGPASAIAARDAPEPDGGQRPRVRRSADAGLVLPHLLLELLAWWPGRIIVEEFEAGQVDTTQLPRLTGVFRDRLARSHLQSPAPVPLRRNTVTSSTCSAEALDPGNILGSLMGLVRWRCPPMPTWSRGAPDARQAARLRCDRARGAPAGKGSPARTFWDTSWEGAIRRAADHATASILPRPACAARPGRAGAGTGSHPTCCTPTSAAPSWRTRAATTRHSTATTRRCAKTR